MPSAIGYSAITFNTSRILGPALGAGLLQSGSALVAYLSAAALMFCALPFLFWIKGRHRDQRTGTSGSFIEELRDGLRYTRDHSSIRLVLGFTLVNALLGRTVIELLPAVSGVLLSGDSATLATLTACAGVGSILGGLVVSRQGGGEARLFRLMAYCLASGAFFVAALGWLQGLQLVAALIGAISLITTIAGTTNQALAQLMVDEEYRGRGAQFVDHDSHGSTGRAGALLMGWLADLFHFPAVLSGFGLLALLAVGWLSRRSGISGQSGSP